MLYRLRATVRGSVLLAQTTVVDFDGVTVRYEVENGTLANIAVETKVDAAEFRSEVLLRTDGTPPTFAFSSNMHTHTRLLTALQELEAHLSFSTNGALATVEWQSATIDRVAETPEEERMVAANSLKYEVSRFTPEARVDPSQLTQLTTLRESQKFLVGPKTFWREGIIEFRRMRYIQAFYNFFFVVESFFAPGESGNRAVVEALHTNDELMGIVAQLAPEVREDPRHSASIERYRGEYKLGTDPKGLVEMMVSIRGDLHHFAMESTRTPVHAFVQDDYETIAWITLGIATYSIIARDPDMPLTYP